MHRRIWWLMLVIGAAGCVQTLPVLQDSAGLDGPFRGRWWSFYQRGAMHVARENYAAAEADFQRALIGRSADAWSARTYGLHFVEYFPNRELGVVYYHTDRLDEAESLLSRSLEHVDTARARHYLDLITKRRLEAGQLTDDQDPRLQAGAADGRVVAQRIVDLEIRADDDLGVEAVSLNGRIAPQRASAADLTLRDTVLLDEGAHAFEVAARDLAGKETASRFEVTVDMTGPAIGILSPALPHTTEATTVEMTGACVDEVGVVSVALDGQPLAEATDGVQRLDFAATLTLADGPNAFVVTARDLAGNETTTTLAIYRGAASSTAAKLWRLEQRLGGPIQTASLSEGQLAQMLAAATEPDEPIRIEVRFPHDRTDTDAYRKSELRLAGRITTTEALQTLRVQDRDFPVIPGAGQFEFSRRVPIHEGENTVAVVAEGAAGHRDEWQRVVRGAPVMLDEYKLAVAIGDFEGAPDDVQTYLRGLLESRLRGGAMERFEVLDRSGLEAVLLEQQIATSELADPRFATRLGKIRPVDLFISGAVFPRDGGGYEIRPQVISTETGLIVADYDTFVQNWNDADERERKAEEIAQWMERAFPRLPGAIARVVGKNAWVDLGSEEGVRKGMKVVVTYEAFPAEIDESTGEVLEEALYDALGWAPVVGVEESRSKLDALTITVEDDTNVAIDQGQPVFTM